MLNFILGPALFTEAVHKKPALLHINPKNLFVGLEAISNLDYFFTLTDQEQKTLLAKLTRKDWTDERLEFVQTNASADTAEFLKRIFMYGLHAHKNLPITADALEEKGHSASLLRGNGGSGKAQSTIVRTADALKDKGFSTHQVQQLLKADNGSHAGQKNILKSTGILLERGFNFDQVTSILHGYDRSSVKIMTTITTICEDLVIKGKAHTAIVYHVRAGSKSSNRKQVVEAYEKRGQI